MRRLLCIVTGLFLASTALAQEGYQIKFKVQGWQDTTAYLGHYYGESTYLKDTARVNSKGEFVFDGKKSLPRGVYFLVLNKAKIFEMVIGTTQRFSLETRSDDYIKGMKVTGDADNKLFFEQMLFNMERHKEAEPFIKMLQDTTAGRRKEERRPNRASIR